MHDLYLSDIIIIISSSSIANFLIFYFWQRKVMYNFIYQYYALYRVMLINIYGVQLMPVYFFFSFFFCVFHTNWSINGLYTFFYGRRILYVFYERRFFSNSLFLHRLNFIDSVLTSFQVITSLRNWYVERLRTGQNLYFY